MFLVMLSVGAVSAVDDVNSTDNVFVDGTNDISCDLQNEYDDVEQVSNDYVIVNSSNYLNYFHGNGTLRYNDDLCFMGISPAFKSRSSLLFSAKALIQRHYSIFSAECL